MVVLPQAWANFLGGRTFDLEYFKQMFKCSCIPLSMNAYQIEDKYTKHNTNYCVKKTQKHTTKNNKNKKIKI